MRRFLPAVLPFVLVSAAAAEPDTVRAKADEYVKGVLGNQDQDTLSKLVVHLRLAPGAPAAMVASCMAAIDAGGSAWNLKEGFARAMEGRNTEVLVAIRPALNEKSLPRVSFAIDVIHQCGLTPACASELVALFARDDSQFSLPAIGALGHCRDPKVVALIVEESRKAGTAGDNALQAVGDCGAKEARARLREVALDTKQSIWRRGVALSGMARSPGTEDVEVAREVLSARSGPAKEPTELDVRTFGGIGEIVDLALDLLLNADATADAAVLKALHVDKNRPRAEKVERLLALGGDEAAIDACLDRAESPKTIGRGEWFIHAGKSGLVAVSVVLMKHYLEEKDETIRMQILRGIGECGDETAIDDIMEVVADPKLGSKGIEALAALGRRRPALLDTVLDRLAALDGAIDSGLGSFPRAYLEKPSPELRVRIIDAYVRLAGRVQDRPRTRLSVTRELTRLCEPDFGWTEASDDQWAAWWAANREGFLKNPPKEK